MASMEGYLWKKGHTLPTMQRRYCVLKGTMLAYYTNQEEFQRKIAPRNVLEVVNVRDWDGSTSLKQYRHAFEVDYLGGTTYQCRAESREEKSQWLLAIQHALDEPDRIVQEEIEEAQRNLQLENEHEEQAMGLAAAAVQAAQKSAQDAQEIDQQIKNKYRAREALDEQLQQAQILYEEATRRRMQTHSSLEVARHKAHDVTMAMEDDEDDEDEDEDEDGNNDQGTHGRRASVASTTVSSMESITDRVARLAAQLEVDRANEETQQHQLLIMEQELFVIDETIAEFTEKAQQFAEEGRKLREAAATSLHQAHSAKQLSRLRISSWTSSSSHLDPLAEGYLLCKHPFKPSMHRRYYVLYGNTLCWYEDEDAYTHHAENPNGVVHVSAVSEWNGKVGGMKTFPHSFAIVTVEGKTLSCSAPTRQNATTWETALHIGLTMPPLSPHRAMAAKARRDSFDLFSSMKGSPTAVPRRASLAHVNAVETPPASVAVVEEEEKKEDESVASVTVVEGYLVKKSSMFPVMKKKYCVLSGLQLCIYDSHDEAARAKSDAQESRDGLVVCGVSEWDGHGALLQYHHGFQLHTVRHQIVQCSAANEQEKAKWIRGVNAALLKYKDQVLVPTGREDAIIEQTTSAMLDTIAKERGEKNRPQDVRSQLRQRLHQYYLEQNPTKAEDVKMLLDKYKGRERALIEHLDRIYETTLTQDEMVIEILATLEKQRGEKLRRQSSGIQSGMLEFVKMQGYLKWVSVAFIPATVTTEILDKRSQSGYCVLSVNKLVCYESEAKYETEPYDPVQVVQVISVADTTLATAFTISCRVETAGEGSPSKPMHWILDAGTAEDKIRWMAKVRSGLGFIEARENPPAPASSPPKPQDTEDQEPAAPDMRELFRRKLIAYYERHNPRKIGEIDTLLHYFTGREKQLLRDLDTTYGTTVSRDPEFLELVESDPGSPDRLSPRTEENFSLFHEGYLWVKHPSLGPSFRKCFCVLRNETWSCYENSRDAHMTGVAPSSPGHSPDPRSIHSGSEPLLADVVQNVTYLNPKLHEMHVFSLETETNGAVLLRADVEQLFQDWTRVLRKSVDAQSRPVGADAPDSEPAQPIDDVIRPLHDKLITFYEIHHPDKVQEVGTLLHAFQGRETQLLVEIDRIYHTQIAQDPGFLSLIPLTSAEIESSQVKDILMEGYLVKRGHLVPSMRKRYCVLVKNVLTYYATHDDSRNPEVQPYGSFSVDIVSDWHGKTTLQTYEHGMELETNDGKTFFCAAFSKEEKTQWMRAFQRGIAIARSENTGKLTQEESDEAIARREQVKERLAAFYRVHNPKKLAELDILLTFYKGRELAMLQDIDVAYGTSISTDEDMVKLLPPSDAFTKSLKALEFHGALELAASSTEYAWGHTRSVYVAQKGLTLTFYASREGYKAGLASASKSERSITLLAVKSIDPTRPRFAIETSEHQWMYFQAPTVDEKNQWMQVLQAALDAILARSLLADSRASGIGETENIAFQGFLLVRIDFLGALTEFHQELKQPTGTKSPKGSRKPKKLESSATKECFVVLKDSNELVFFDDAQHTVPIATVSALSTRAWADEATNAVPTGRFAFQIVTQEQVVVSCSAATDLERAQWIQQIRVGAEHVAAMEMLAEQFQDVQQHSPSNEHVIESADDEAEITVPARRQRRGSVLDEATGQRRGFLFYAVDEKKSNGETEGFVVLSDRGELSIYSDEAAFFQQAMAILQAQAMEILASSTAGVSIESVSNSSVAGRFAKLFGGTASSSMDESDLAFRVEVQHDDTRLVSFYPASHEERELWITAFTQGISLHKGEQLLRDEKLIMELDADKPAQAPAPIETREDLAVPNAAMEGFLTPWHGSFGSTPTHPGAEFFAVLQGCHLRGFPSKEVTIDAASSFVLSASPDLDVISIADWSPTTKANVNSDDSTSRESCGFRIDAQRFGVTASPTTWYVTAPTVEQKQQWVQVIKQELEFALAERYLDDEAKEFARQVADHVRASQMGSTVQDGAPPQRMEGYIRVRHQFVGSIWRERFAVVLDTTLFLFKDGADAVAEDWEKRATERHVIISAKDWLASSSTVSIRSQGSFRYGIRLENEDGAMLECTFATEDDRDSWLRTLKTILRNAAQSDDVSTRMTSRDPALPFVTGAAMEGYLKIREPGHFKSMGLVSPRWKARYSVLLGTQWLLYKTQEVAIALHDQNQQQDAGTESTSLPSAVYEVELATPWDSESETSNLSIRKPSSEMETHGFVVEVQAYGGVTSSRSDGQRMRVECKAHTSLERKRWLNAMEDQLLKAQEDQELVSRAIQQQDEKTRAQNTVKTKFQMLRDDAIQQSAMLKDILETLTGSDDADSSNQSDSSSEGEEEKKEYNEYHSPPPSLPSRRSTSSRMLGRSPENSPMYRRRRSSQTSAQSARRASGVDSLRQFFPDTDADDLKPKPLKTDSNQPAKPLWWSFQSIFGCCFDRPPSTAVALASIAPLDTTKFRYISYHEDLHLPVYPEEEDY